MGRIAKKRIKEKMVEKRELGDIFCEVAWLLALWVDDLPLLDDRLAIQVEVVVEQGGT